MKVDLVIAGAGKAGTTALHTWLDRHPDICMSRPKETQHFMLGWDLEPAFAHRTSERVAGESTVGALHTLWPVERIARHSPDAVIVVLLRDPIHRAHSGWWMHRTRGDEHRTFLDAVTDEMRKGVDYRPDEDAWRRHITSIGTGQIECTNYVSAGVYTPGIDCLRETFDRVLIFTHDQLTSNPQSVGGQVCAAVGVDPALLPVQPEVVNAGIGRRAARGRKALPGLPDRPPRPKGRAVSLLRDWFAADVATCGRFLEVPWARHYRG